MLRAPQPSRAQFTTVKCYAYVAFGNSWISVGESKRGFSQGVGGDAATEPRWAVSRSTRLLNPLMSDESAPPQQFNNDAQPGTRAIGPNGEIIRK